MKRKYVIALTQSDQKNNEWTALGFVPIRNDPSVDVAEWVHDHHPNVTSYTWAHTTLAANGKVGSLKQKDYRPGWVYSKNDSTLGIFLGLVSYAVPDPDPRAVRWKADHVYDKFNSRLGALWMENTSWSLSNNNTTKNTQSINELHDVMSSLNFLRIYKNAPTYRMAFTKLINIPPSIEVIRNGFIKSLPLFAKDVASWNVYDCISYATITDREETVHISQEAIDALWYVDLWIVNPITSRREALPEKLASSDESIRKYAEELMKKYAKEDRMK